MTDKKYKVLFLGGDDNERAKLLESFIGDKFKSDFEEKAGVDFLTKRIQINSSEEKKDVELIIWNCSSEKRFQELISSCYLCGAEGAIIVIDLTDKDALKKAEYYFNLCMKNNKKMPLVLLADKIDSKEKEIEEDQISDFAEKHKKFIKWRKSSAIAKEKLEESFEELTKEILKIPK